MAGRTLGRALTRRRVAVMVVTVVLPAVLVFGLGHRGAHAARNLLVPGAGLFESAWVLGVIFLVVAVAATVLWVRWGADWAVIAVLTAAVGVTLAVSPRGHAAGTPSVTRSAHEFPLVMLVLAGWHWLRSLPVIGRLHRRVGPGLDGLDDLDRLPPVDRCRAVTVLVLAGAARGEHAAAIDRPDVVRRARRISFVARGRRGSRALERDHASWRTARAALGDEAVLVSMRDDGARCLAGVPASEPGWVRLLDGALAASLVTTNGDIAPWTAMWECELALHRGHRPATYWTPLGTCIGRAEVWEHALASALMPGSPDWPALRARVLGAAARGSQRPLDERLIAAGRLWLNMVDDPEAARILSRPTVRRDPLACAIDLLAASRRPGRTDLRGVPQ